MHPIYIGLKADPASATIRKRRTKSILQVASNPLRLVILSVAKNQFPSMLL
jgi:hypothetical protein